MRRPRRKRRAAIAAFVATHRVKLPLRKPRTSEPIRPAIMTLGRLIEMVEAEERLDKVDRANDERQAG